MENLKLILPALLLGTSLACGSKADYLVHQPPPTTPPGLKQFISGNLIATDDRTIDLSKDDGLPLVLIFSNDSCSTCAAEAEDIKKTLRIPTQGPTKIHLYTLLNGAIKADAVYWKNIHQIPWDVGYDENSTLFMKYCPDHTQIPCTLVQVPGQGVLLVHQGQTKIATIVSLTGPWE